MVGIEIVEDFAGIATDDKCSPEDPFRMRIRERSFNCSSKATNVKPSFPVIGMRDGRRNVLWRWTSLRGTLKN